MPKSSLVRCTIFALGSRCLKERTTQKHLQRAPVWNRPNTLRRLSQKCFYNSRMLERNWLRVPFVRMLGPFYSSEVLPPFLVEQVSSLQSKLHPCRASLILIEQVFWNVVGKSGLSFCQGPTQRMGSTFFGLVDMGLLGSRSLISYFILFKMFSSFDNVLSLQ